jgi:hypothetical protein
MRLLVVFTAAPLGFSRRVCAHVGDDADIRIPPAATPDSAAVWTLPTIRLKNDAKGKARPVSHLVLLDPCVLDFFVPLEDQLNRNRYITLWFTARQERSRRWSAKNSPEMQGSGRKDSVDREFILAAALFWGFLSETDE